MPIERRNSSAQVRSIIIGVVSVAFIGLLAFAVIRAATGGGTSVTTSGSNGEWNLGPVESKVEAIRDGGPILIPDPAGSQRLPIFISHTGNDNTANWYAFEARPPDSPDDCFLEWDRDAEEFTAPCVEETFPVTGEGLRNFGTSVTEDGELIIDLTPGDG